MAKKVTVRTELLKDTPDLEEYKTICPDYEGDTVPNCQIEVVQGEGADSETLDALVASVEGEDIDVDEVVYIPMMHEETGCEKTVKIFMQPEPLILHLAVIIWVTFKFKTNVSGSSTQTVPAYAFPFAPNINEMVEVPNLSVDPTGNTMHVFPALFDYWKDDFGIIMGYDNWDDYYLAHKVTGSEDYIIDNSDTFIGYDIHGATKINGTWLSEDDYSYPSGYTSWKENDLPDGYPTDGNHSINRYYELGGPLFGSGACAPPKALYEHHMLDTLAEHYNMKSQGQYYEAYISGTYQEWDGNYYTGWPYMWREVSFDPGYEPGQFSDSYFLSVDTWIPEGSGLSGAERSCQSNGNVSDSRNSMSRWDDEPFWNSNYPQGYYIDIEWRLQLGLENAPRTVESARTSRGAGLAFHDLFLGGDTGNYMSYWGMPAGHQQVPQYHAGIRNYDPTFGWWSLVYKIGHYYPYDGALAATSKGLYMTFNFDFETDHNTSDIYREHHGLSLWEPDVAEAYIGSTSSIVYTRFDSDSDAGGRIKWGVSLGLLGTNNFLIEETGNITFSRAAYDHRLLSYNIWYNWCFCQWHRAQTGDPDDHEGQLGWLPGSGVGGTYGLPTEPGWWDKTLEESLTEERGTDTHKGSFIPYKHHVIHMTEPHSEPIVDNHIMLSYKMIDPDTEEVKECWEMFVMVPQLNSWRKDTSYVSHGNEEGTTTIPDGTSYYYQEPDGVQHNWNWCYPDYLHYLHLAARYTRYSCADKKHAVLAVSYPALDFNTVDPFNPPGGRNTVLENAINQSIAKLHSIHGNWVWDMFDYVYPEHTTQFVNWEYTLDPTGQKSNLAEDSFVTYDVEAEVVETTEFWLQQQEG